MIKVLILLAGLLISISLLAQKQQIVFTNNDSLIKPIDKINIASNFKDTFTFTKQWKYPVGTYKDDNGKFTTDGSPLDTSHLYYTANCVTNVQGGYNINYCYAKVSKNKIYLTFTDGLPAYASSFYVELDSLNFSCRAETIYPVMHVGEKKYCTITKQQLIVDKPKYKKGTIIKGYINMEFTETVTINNELKQNKNHYCKGYFKTKIK